MRTRAKVAIGGALIGLSMVTATALPLAAHESSSAGGTPTVDQDTMKQTTTPESGDAEMAKTKDQMMDQCLAMMEMMSSMMGMMGGADMPDMEGMEGMQGVEDMPSVSATPGA